MDPAAAVRASVAAVLGIAPTDLHVTAPLAELREGEGGIRWSVQLSMTQVRQTTCRNFFLVTSLRSHLFVVPPSRCAQGGLSDEHNTQ